MNPGIRSCFAILSMTQRHSSKGQDPSNFCRSGSINIGWWTRSWSI